jgi:hypothetical protein
MEPAPEKPQRTDAAQGRDNSQEVDDLLSGPAWSDSRMIGRDHSWTAFSIRSESEIHPNRSSALRSEAS